MMDIKHINHAIGFLAPGGILVALCANGPRQQQEFQAYAEHWEDLPAGSFKEAGTNVNVALMVWRAEEATEEKQEPVSEELPGISVAETFNLINPETEIGVLVPKGGPVMKQESLF